MSKTITQRTLMGYREGKINSHAFDDLINQFENKSDQVVKTILNKNKWKVEGDGDMKFDVVVGNPPYQQVNKGNGNGADPVYHYFIDVARKVSDRGTFIHPARFLSNAGKTPKEWNDKMLHDKHFKIVAYWINSKDVFSSVDIKGGVVVSYWDKKKDFGEIGIFTSHEELKTILQKNMAYVSNCSFANLIYPNNLYTFSENLYKENPFLEGRYSEGHRNNVGTNIFELYPEIFSNDKPQNSIDYLGLLGRASNGRCIKYARINYFILPDNYDKYKVLITKANGSVMFGEVLSSPIVAEPNIGHTDTFLSVGKFETLKEAENCLKYLKSKYVRTLLGILKVTQDNPADKWKLVPLQDFTPSSDIDWTQSVSDIDKQLYKKYGLSDEEIKFIEAKVQKME